MAGRPPLEFIRKYFKYNETTKKSKCEIDNCGTEIKGQAAFALERHVKSKHKDEALVIEQDRLEQEKKKQATKRRADKDICYLHVKISRAEIEKATVLHTTVDGNSFRSLEGVGLRMILDPVLEAYNKASTSPALSIHRRSVHGLIRAEAAALKEKIRKEVGGKMVCVKIDAASRNDRRVVSINIQYTHQGELKVRNLCVRETTESHTAEFLNKLVMDTLHDFDLLCSQVLSGTADNGANVKKAMQSLSDLDLGSVEFSCYHAGVGDSDEDDSGAEETVSPNAAELGEKPAQETPPATPGPSSVDIFEFQEDSGENSSGEESGEGSDTELDEQGSGEQGDGSSSEEESEAFPSLETLTFPEFEPSNADVCEDCRAVKHALTFSGVKYVPCAAHTLQLAVGDAVNFPAMESVLKKARRLAVKLRTHRYAVKLRQAGCNKAVLCNETRWSSIYQMMNSLLTLRPTIEKIVEEEQKAAAPKKKPISQGKTRSSKRGVTPAPPTPPPPPATESKKKKKKLQNMSPGQWRQVGAYCKALKPAAMATTKFQKTDLTAGEFYGEWLACIQRTQKVGSLLAQRVVEAMRRREGSLLECDVFVPAVFMDPRYKSLLNGDQRKSAINYLQALAVRLEHLGLDGQEQNDNEETPENPDNPASLEVNEDDDDLEELLKSTEKSGNVVKENNIFKLLSDYNEWERVPKEVNVFKYWYERRLKSPVLHMLSEVVLSVPMTQVSVERTFSHFKQILTMLRFNLSAEMLNDVLFIKCNYHLQK